MARLSWFEQNYQTGVDQGVFFSKDGLGEAWNGLISVNENPVELRSQVHYRDGIKLINRRSEDSFSATVEAFTYPESLSERIEFGFSYRVNSADGYLTHVVYNARAKFSNRTYGQDEVTPFVFDISTRPRPIPGGKPSAHLIVDTSKAYSWTVIAFEEILYGGENNASRLPSPEEVFDIFEVNSILRIIDNGDGTWTATGPDDVIQMLDPTTFQIDWPSAVFVYSDAYKITSL